MVFLSPEKKTSDEPWWLSSSIMWFVNFAALLVNRSVSMRFSEAVVEISRSRDREIFLTKLEDWSRSGLCMFCQISRAREVMTGSIFCDFFISLLFLLFQYLNYRSQQMSFFAAVIEFLRTNFCWNRNLKNDLWKRSAGIILVCVHLLNECFTLFVTLCVITLQCENIWASKFKW